MRVMQKYLIITGIALVAIGLAWPWIARLGLDRWPGRLPGDIIWKGETTQVYFPIVTCLLLSVGLSLIIWLINR